MVNDSSSDKQQTQQLDVKQMSAIKTRSDLLLALLYADGHETSQPAPIEGITRLEKLLFLLKVQAGFLEEPDAKETFNFVPFKMGPWTAEVYDEVDFLDSLGLISKRAKRTAQSEDVAHREELYAELLLDKYTKGSTSGDSDTEIYALTQRGMSKAGKLWDTLTPREKQQFIELKRAYNDMNLKDFLRYVYSTYPDYASASEIKDQLFKRKG